MDDTTSAAYPLVRKLAAVHDLDQADHDALERLCRFTRNLAAGEDIVRRGDRPRAVHVVLDGFAQRYKIVSDGGRQILALLVPGDFCDLHVTILGEMDHSLAALTPCRVATISAASIRELTWKHPEITHAFWWSTLVDEAILREWLTSVGRRAAVERTAHLIVELFMRLRLVGLTSGMSFELPIAQTNLADIVGLTPVHLNRTLQELRGANLILLERRRLTILDMERLQQSCGFDPTYLHLRRSERSEGS